jgi:putative membrane protein
VRGKRAPEGERKVAVPYNFYIHGPGSGWWVGGAIMMIIFWGAVVLLLLLAFRHFGHHHDVVPQEPAAIETLKMRLAKGEIDADEFQRRVDLIRNTK